MGGAARILNLLSTPLPILHSHPVTVNLSRYTQLPVTSLHIHRHRRSLSLFPPLAGNFRFRIHPYDSAFHGESSGSSSFADSSSATASGSEVVRISWPEWGRFVDCFSGGLRKGGEGCGLGGVDAGDDSFSGFEKFPTEFVAAAEICLRFARQRPEVLRLLTKKDVDLVVENGSPFLFKHALNSLKRMRAFVNSADCSISDNETGRAETVDLMRYLLGHVYNNLFSPRAYTRATKAFEESVCNLFNQLTILTETIQRTKFAGIYNQSSTGVQQPNFVETYNQSSTGFQQPNFVETYNQSSTSFQQSSLHSGQNIEMKRGDWICSNSKFMNFAKNAKCLECQMARPKRQLTGGEWECPQCDFFNYGRNMACLKCDCKHPPSPFIGGISAISSINKTEIEHKLAENDEKSERWLNMVIKDKNIPEIMSLREGSNRHVNSRRMLQEELTLNQYKRNTRENDVSRIAGTKSAISETLERLDKIIAEKPAFYTEGKVSGQTGSSNCSSPFVPLRADMFKKSQTNGWQQQKPSETPNSRLKSVKWINDSSFEIFETDKSIDNQTGVVQEEQCPEIITMPIGENQFVVSNSNLNNVANDEDLPEIKPSIEGASSHVDSDCTMPLEGSTKKKYMRNTGDIDNGRIGGTKSQFSKFLENLDRIIDQQTTPTDMFKKFQTGGSPQKQPFGISDSSFKSNIWVTKISATEKYINKQTGSFQEQEFPDALPMRMREDQYDVSQKKYTDMSNLNNVVNDDLSEIMLMREDASTLSKHVDSDGRMPPEGSTDKKYTRNTGGNDSSRITGTKSQISKFLERLDSIIDQQTKLPSCRKETS